MTNSTPGAAPKLRLDADELTTRDMKRARVALGRDPYELLAADDNEDRMTFVMWCLLSRTNPDLTWDQALDTPLGVFDMGGPPPTPESAVNGASPKKRGSRASGTTPSVTTPEPSAAPTST